MDAIHIFVLENIKLPQFNDSSALKYLPLERSIVLDKQNFFCRFFSIQFESDPPHSHFKENRLDHHMGWVWPPAYTRAEGHMDGNHLLISFFFSSPRSRKWIFLIYLKLHDEARRRITWIQLIVSRREKRIQNFCRLVVAWWTEKKFYRNLRNLIAPGRVEWSERSRWKFTFI